MTDRPATDDMAMQPEGGAATAAAPELVPAEQVTAALEAAAEFKDKLLRTLADMENLRRRTEREVAMLGEFSRRSGRPVSFGLTQSDRRPELYGECIHRVHLAVHQVDVRRPSVGVAGAHRIEPGLQLMAVAVRAV